MRPKAPAEDWRVVLLRDPCVYCGGTPTGLDHIVPQARHGADAWWNRAPACATCDSQKGMRPLLVFLVGLPVVADPRAPRHLVAERPPTPPLYHSLADKLREVGYVRSGDRDANPVVE